MTTPRRPHSGWLLVGSTPARMVKVDSAGQRFRSFLANSRCRFVLALLRCARSSSALSSPWSGATRSSRRVRSPSLLNSSHALKRRAAIARPTAPNALSAASPSLAVRRIVGLGAPCGLCQHHAVAQAEQQLAQLLALVVVEACEEGVFGYALGAGHVDETRPAGVSEVDAVATTVSEVASAGDETVSFER